jgi:dTDP-4-dehydrorhamnose reductase
MARWLVVGAGGMLGTDVVADLRAAGHDVTTAGRSEGMDIGVDLLDAGSCAAAVSGQDVVANCAAWTAVDDAETHEPQAFWPNAVGAANLARACAAGGARLVHVSTDYVFDGTATTPYPEDAPLAPVSAYGRTKAAGEWAVRAEAPDALVVRTAWLYGAHGPSFVRTMLTLAEKHESLSVVDDQRGQPTWTVDLAAAMRRLVEAEAPAGVWHGTSGGEVTWFGFTRRIFELAGLDPQRVSPTTSEAYPRPAPRPAFSVLGKQRWTDAGIEPIRDWDAALVEALPAIRSALG